MPESGQKPYDSQINYSTDAPLPVASQGDIDIFTEPGAKGNVPASPEIGNAFGQIRMMEVLRYCETKHFTKSDSHKRVATEIKVQLHGVGKRAKPRQRSRDTFKTNGTHFVPESTDTVSQ